MCSLLGERNAREGHGSPAPLHISSSASFSSTLFTYPPMLPIQSKVPLRREAHTIPECSILDFISTVLLPGDIDHHRHSLYLGLGCMSDPTTLRLHLLSSDIERPMKGRQELRVPFSSRWKKTQQPNDRCIIEQWQTPKLPWRPRYLEFSQRLDTESLPSHSGQSLGWPVNVFGQCYTHITIRSHGSVSSSCWSAKIRYVHKQQSVAFGLLAALPFPRVTPPSLREPETLEV